MKRVAVTYRSLVQEGEGVRMVIKHNEFKAEPAAGTISAKSECGYSAEGSSLMRFYGGGKFVMVPKSDIVNAEGDE